MVGVIVHDGQPHTLLIAPATVRAGNSFTVTVSTVAYCKMSEDTTLVLTEGTDVVIVPYDRWAPLDDDEGCPAILMFVRHVATIQFDEAGTRTIRVRGQHVERLSGAVPPDGEVVDILFPVEVL